MYPYSTEFRPAAPVLVVEFLSLLPGRRIEVLALVDSGSDLTVIPDNIASRLALNKTGSTAARGLHGSPSEHSVFSVRVTVRGEETVYARAITWERDYALLGRNVLNHWKVVLDGPAAMLSISQS